MNKMPDEFKKVFIATKTVKGGKAKRFGDNIPNLFPDHEKILGAEVGTHLGHHAVIMCRTAPNLELYCVDMWELHWKRHNKDYTGQDKDGIAKAFKNYDYGVKTFQKCLENLQPFAQQIHIVKEDSTIAKDQFDDGYFDFVYVDADHSTDGCYRDLMAWFPKIKSGGYITGHDYGVYGVDIAVDRFRLEHDLDFVTREGWIDNDWVMGPI